MTSTVSLYPTPAKVTILAATIATVAAEYQVPLVVDLGAGQAHLSHILAYHFGLDVLAVDNDASQTSGALRRQVRASKRAAKLQGAVAVVVACHGGERAGLTKCITRFCIAHGGALFAAARTGLPLRLGEVEHLTADIRGTSFTETVNAALERRLAALEATGRPRRWLLCGLHTCGDLACDTLRMFATGYRQKIGSLIMVEWCSNTLALNSDGVLTGSTATAVINIGCCYQWVTERPGADPADALPGRGSMPLAVQPHALKSSSSPAAPARPPGVTPSGRVVTNPNHRWCHLSELPEMPGFPLSALGCSLGLALGRKAKNLANQAVHSWPTSAAELDALYFKHYCRAAFQVRRQPRSALSLVRSAAVEH